MRSKFCLSLLGAALLLACTSYASQDPGVLSNPTISKPVGFVVTPPLRDLAREQPQEIPFGFHEATPARDPKEQLRRHAKREGVDSFRDPVASGANSLDTIPIELLDWLGIGKGFFGYGVYIVPSDMNLSIGDTEIVQWGNNNFTVFDLNGNDLLSGVNHYLPGNVLFSGLPRCGQTNDGDSVAQWDKIAHRWVMIQSAQAPPTRDCIAVSQTPDALGSWYAYEFATPESDTEQLDYTKLGVWPDGYYVSHNDFLYKGGPFQGTIPCAYERTKMLAGDSKAQQVCFLDRPGGSSHGKGDWPGSFDDNQLPGDLDSPNSLPPAGTPDLYFGSIDNTSDGYVNNLYYYKFHVDWDNPLNSTFSCVGGTCPLPVPRFYLGSWLNLAPQPGVTDGLQTLANRLMYRLAYRVLPSPVTNATVKGGPQQSWLISHAVNNNWALAIRWYELRAPLGSTDPYVYQTGTYAPDLSWRFMSSMAMDKAGNIAMSYTVTNATSVYPTIGFTGRAANDPPGTMGWEQIVISGTGSQTDSDNRWGDYYNMSLSNDGCTFVTTGEYYTATASFDWSSRIAKLRFGNCIP
jgi:hypothetical protein